MFCTARRSLNLTIKKQPLCLCDDLRDTIPRYLCSSVSPYKTSVSFPPAIVISGSWKLFVFWGLLIWCFWSCQGLFLAALLDIQDWVQAKLSHLRLSLPVAGVVPEVPGRARSRKVAPEQIGLQRFQSTTSRQARIGWWRESEQLVFRDCLTKGFSCK